MHNAMQKCQNNFYVTEFMPKMYDAWFCDDKNSGDTYYFILMEKYDGNLIDFINLFKRQNENTKKVTFSLIETKLKILKQALYHIHNTCNNICINDIKLENILYKEYNHSYDFIFADFGLTAKLPYYVGHVDAECKKQDFRKLDNVIDNLINECRLSLSSEDH